MSAELRDMLAAQLEVQEKTFGYDFHTMSDAMAVDYIRAMVLAATDELHEALHEVPWKGWKKGTIDRPKYFGELIDVWTFLMNLMLVTGATPDTIADEMVRQYEEKRKLNVQRQEHGYSV